MMMIEEAPVAQSEMDAKPKVKAAKQKEEEGGASSARCTHCSRQYHTADQCWKLHPDKKPKSLQKHGKTEEKSASADEKVDKQAAIAELRSQIHALNN